MEQMLALVSERPFATSAGLFGMLCLVVYPLFQARPLLLTVHLGNNLGFAVHYGLLGQPAALMMNLMMGVQTLVAIRLLRRPGLRWMYYALVPMLLCAAATTWQGWLSLLSVTATVLSTLGRIQSNEVALRALMLASGPLWATHDLLVGSAPGLLGDVSCIATGTWMLLKACRPPTAEWTLEQQESS